MLFNSINFLIFFPIVCMGYFIIPRGKRYIWLLLASYYFYMSWNVKYVLLLFASTLITYLSSIFVSYFEDREDWTEYKLAIVSFDKNTGELVDWVRYNLSIGIDGK